MVRVSRRSRRPFAVFGVGLVGFSILPNQIGYQDLGALIARQPEVAERWRKHIIASPFGTIHAAMFSLPRPIGTSIPAPPLYALASVDPNEITGALGRQTLGNSFDPNAPIQFPSVNRKTKGDALVQRPRTPLPPLAALPAKVEQPSEPRTDPVVERAPTPQASVTHHDKAAAARPADAEMSNAGLPPNGHPALLAAKGEDSSEALLYFGAHPISPLRQTLAPWRAGEAPVVMPPRGAARAPVDPETKLAALTTPAMPLPDIDQSHGESIAPKGEVTGESQRPMSPAERLKLTSVARAKAEKCLTNAVYFEARDEPVRAQIAVAQVVLNRVFSPYYPNDVCGVVYQNAHRHLACQFTFACDGKRNAVTEPDAWLRAKRIASEILDGKLWMPAVAKSTHYHDDWAHPNWVREMRKLDKLGGLIFYRPRNWGDGAEEPKWGDPKTTAKTAAAL
ncbi:MAG: cell wall hydrolase [Pseudolabrys sp.]